MSVSVTAGTSFNAGVPAPLFKVNTAVQLIDYDVSKDGQRFLTLTTVAEAELLPFTVLLNWRSR
jgi:hypothetical protein